MTYEKLETFQDSTTRILIVDDHPIFSFGMTELINQAKGLKVCGMAEDADEAWEIILKQKPDLVIIDITLKKSDGLDLVKKINKKFKTLPLLVLSMHNESLYAERALLAGAKGYIMKQEATESVVCAIHHVLSGRIYASEEIKDSILNKHLNPAQADEKSPINKLTNRELEVLQLIGQGFSTKEIASDLSLSIKTIGTYRERIKEKMDLKHATELISYAVSYYKNGL